MLNTLLPNSFFSSNLSLFVFNTMAIFYICTLLLLFLLFFFFNDTATPEISTLPLHDALPIWVIYPPIAIPAAVLAGLVAAAQIVWQPSQTMAAADPWQSLVRVYALLAALLPYMLVVAVLYAAMTVAAVDAVAGRAVDVRRALRFVVRPRVLLTQLAVFFLEGVALIFCLLPALYVWPLVRMTVPAMADEGVTGAAAIGRSAELAHHNPRRRLLTSPLLKILALMAVVPVISLLATAVLQLPLMLVQVLVFMRKAASGEDLPGWFSSFLWLQVPLRCLASLIISLLSLYSPFPPALPFF